MKNPGSAPGWIIAYNRHLFYLCMHKLNYGYIFHNHTIIVTLNNNELLVLRGNINNRWHHRWALICMFKKMNNLRTRQDIKKNWKNLDGFPSNNLWMWLKVDEWFFSWYCRLNYAIHSVYKKPESFKFNLAITCCSNLIALTALKSCHICKSSVTSHN